MMTAFDKAWTFLKGTPLEQSGFDKPISMDPKYGDYRYYEDEGFLTPQFKQQITSHYPRQIYPAVGNYPPELEEADAFTSDPTSFPEDENYGVSMRAPKKLPGPGGRNEINEPEHAGLTRLQNPATQDMLRRFVERAANEHVGYTGQMERASQYAPGDWNYGKNYPNVENLRDIYGDPLRPVPAIDMLNFPSVGSIIQQRHEDRPPSTRRRRKEEPGFRETHPLTPLIPNQNFAENWERMERGE
jgi:hypothetical protein